MRFTPKTEKEIQEEGLLQPGTYSFEIVSAEEKTSAKGNDMIELKLFVYDDEGRPRTMRDFLMESIAYKLRHAAEVCGLLDDYEAGELSASDFIGKTGQLKIRIEKDKNGQYPDKNGVADYVRPEDSMVSSVKPVSAHNRAKADAFQAARDAQAPIDGLNDEIPW